MMSVAHQSSQEHQRRCLSLVLFNDFFHALEMPPKHLVSLSDTGPLGRDKEVVKDLKSKLGIVNPGEPAPMSAKAGVW